MEPKDEAIEQPATDEINGDEAEKVVGGGGAYGDDGSENG